MTPLSRVITQIQRDAADTATEDLRADIEIGFEVLDARAASRPAMLAPIATACLRPDTAASPGVINDLLRGTDC